MMQKALLIKLHLISSVNLKNFLIPQYELMVKRLGESFKWSYSLFKACFFIHCSTLIN